MKQPLLILLATLCGASVLPGQEDDLTSRYEKKLASPFLEKNDWELDFDRALINAKGDVDTYLFAYFTRSYAP